MSIDSGVELQLTIKKSNDSFPFPLTNRVPPVKLIYSKNGLSFFSHQETVTSWSHQFQTAFLFSWLCLWAEKSKEGALLKGKLGTCWQGDRHR